MANLNADKLDGQDSADFAAAGDVLFAAVADGGTLGANRGATASTLNNATTTTVTFNRDVSKCSFTATANGTAPDILAAQVAAASGSGATQVVVTEADGATATAFHLQVIC